MVVGYSFRSLVVAGFRAGRRSLCRASLRRWSVGWHERGMATNHDTCRGSCFYDAPRGPPTLGSPLPLFSIPYSSAGKVPSPPTSLWRGEGRRAAVGSAHRGALLIEPTPLRIGEGLVAEMLRGVGREPWWRRAEVVVEE